MNYFLKVSFILIIGILLMSLSMPKKDVKVVCQLEFASTNDSLSLFQFDGLGFELIKKIGHENQTFEFTVPKSKPTFYYIGTDNQNIKSIILGTEKNVEINGNFKKIRQITFTSEINNDYNKMMSDATTLKQKSIEERGNLVKLLQSGKDISSAAKKLAKIDQEKMILLQATKKKNKFLGNISTLYIYLSFHNNRGQYNQEIDYFGNEYFSLVDFSQDDFNRTPTVYDAILKYTTMLSKTRGLPKEKLEEFVDKLLKRIPKNTMAYKMGLGGVIGALGPKNHASYSKYAKQYIDLYNNDGSQNTVNLITRYSRTKNLVIGGTAPDFTMKTHEGTDLNLKELRGKYVLLDFWASWCGPCRRANPHVVAVYNKFKNKGFTVYSVSLDGDRRGSTDPNVIKMHKDKWVNAIKKDGLIWPYHVSDLKSWNSAASAKYGVTSIPATYLIGRDGRILAINPRANLETLVAKFIDK